MADEKLSLVLDTTDASPSDKFLLAGGRTFFKCDTHTGGTWALQSQSPEDVWEATDVEIDSTVAELGFTARPGMICRLHGGATGARVWVSRRG